ncbi:ATP-binding protein [Pedobacter sp. AW31-3R]|uniref:ATP-binding protein n=1 Tax=Pedobacter sp. AW31-3R TaxID=3445781 RepID=UPI003FA0F46F
MNVHQSFTDREILEVLSLSSKATAIYSTDEIIIESANDAMIAFWGKDRSIIGQPLGVAVPELNGQPFIAMLQRVLRTGITDSGKAIPAETRIRGEKLQVSYFDYEYRAIKNAAGETYCILHTAEDVTANVVNLHALEKAERKAELLNREQQLNEELAASNEELNSTNEELFEAQESLKLLNNELENRVAERTVALAKSEASLKYMIADAPIAIGVFKGREMMVETANQKLLEAWGKTGEIVGKPLHVALPELVGQDFLYILDDVYSTGVPFFGNEIRASVVKNNAVEEVYSNFVYHPLKNMAGQTTHIMLVAHLVTEQVIARRKVEDAEEMLRVSVEAANAGTWYMDVKTRHFKGSARLKELFGFKPEEEISFDDITSKIPEEYRRQVLKGVDMALSKGEPYFLEHPVMRSAEQGETWVSAQGKVFKDGEGKNLHFSGMIMDITQQKRDEHRKNDFISMVSHELKTPLTSLSGYIQLLERNARKTGDESGIQLMHKAGNQLRKMTSMINGFLNISRLESGKIHLQKQEFELDELIRDMIEDTRISSSNFQFHLSPCEPVLVYADRDKVGAVISNLLSNAVKYSPNKNQVIVKCELKNNSAVVSIEDEGLGIDQEDAKKLFQRFYRIDNKDNPNISGFGIGLYLSAEIIQHHGGKIWVESEKGKGSIFYFSLPLQDKA